MNDLPSLPAAGDVAPGDESDGFLSGLVTCAIGFGLALVLTATSFWVARKGAGVLWGPGIPIGLCVLAIAQMGVHLVFFLRITTGPDNSNNVLALAFGVLIVFLVIAGSLWIIANLNHGAMPMAYPSREPS